MSYAGRTQLVNIVLLNLHSYWASIFFLPEEFLDEVISIRKNYLWSCKAYSSKSAHIAWDLICRRQNEGGLGFKQSYVWNLSMLGKYVWSIAMKSDNLWVKWINHIYLKGKDWKSYVPGSNVSWYWRKLCKVKDTFRAGYSQDRWSFNRKGYIAAGAYKWLRIGQMGMD